MTLIPIAIGIALMIIVMELLFWRLFRMKIEGLLFPHETDTSSLHFFTLGRIKFCILLHACFIFAVFFLSILFLW